MFSVNNREGELLSLASFVKTIKNIWFSTRTACVCFFAGFCLQANIETHKKKIPFIVLLMGVYTQEKIGLIPQSIVRTLDRLRRQLLPEGRVLALEEFRISRLRTIVALQCLFILITVPVFVHFIGKGIVIKPSVQYFWNIQHNEIFLNSYQTKRAYYEMREFHNILFFESLTQDRSLNERVHLCQQSTSINPDSQPLSERFKVNQMVNLASQHESSFPTIIETTNLLSSESKLDDVEEQIKNGLPLICLKM